MDRRTVPQKIMLLAAVLATVGFVAFPLLWMLSSSLMPYDELFGRRLRLLPTAPTLGHYADLLERTRFPEYFRNSAIVAALATVGAIVCATLAGYGLTRFRFPGKRAISGAVLFTYMFPPILMAIPLFVMLKQVGLTNNLFGLALAHISFAMPLAMWLSAIFFRAIPIELDEAAMIDGASRLGALWRVILPVAAPGLVAIAVFVFVLSWNDYLFSLILMVAEAKKTLPVGVAGFQDATSVEWGLIMAGGVLITVPVMLGFMLVQRWLIAGLGAGAVKE
ncbi:MAG: carbohydrate ABC transporter permease [Alphaproteobacteria bacterium]|nr:carbohydrate ABC transporter permease [Alphaproteobacteria bacterium]